MGVAKREPFKKRLHAKPLGSKGPNKPGEEFFIFFHTIIKVHQ
jgi:hypothetical protein